jgi:hypothetical protein
VFNSSLFFNVVFTFFFTYVYFTINNPGDLPGRRETQRSFLNIPVLVSMLSDG